MKKIKIIALFFILSTQFVYAQVNYNSFLNAHFNYYDSALVNYSKIKMTTLIGNDTNHLLPIRQQIYMNGFLYNDIQGIDITNHDSIDKELTFSYNKDKTIQSIYVTYYPRMFKTNNGEVLKYDLKGDYLGPKFGQYTGGDVNVVLKPEKISEDYNWVTYLFKYYSSTGKLLDQDTIISGNTNRIIKIDSFHLNNYLIITKKLKGSFIKEYCKYDSLKFSERWDTATDGSINKFTDTVGKILEPPNSPEFYYKYISEYNSLGRKISDEYFEYVHGYIDPDKQEYINDYLTEYARMWYYDDGKIAVQDQYDYNTDNKLVGHSYQHFSDDNKGIDKYDNRMYWYKQNLLIEVSDCKGTSKLGDNSCFYYRYKYDALQ